MTSYKGFTIECESTDAASPWNWCVIGVDEHVYNCGGREYECSGDAERAAEQWIDYYIKSLSNTDTVKATLRIQERLKAIEEELKKHNDSYAEHYSRNAEGAMMARYIDEAIEILTKALKINEQTIRKAHRENG